LSGGGDTPSPTPVPAEGVAQLFMDEGCTTLAEGDLSGMPTLYLRFNDAVEDNIVLLSKAGPGHATIDVSDQGIDLMFTWGNHEAVPPISAGTIVPLEGLLDYTATWDVNQSIYILGE
jgi:hypothetical protein